MGSSSSEGSVAQWQARTNPTENTAASAEERFRLFSASRVAPSHLKGLAPRDHVATHPLCPREAAPDWRMRICGPAHMRPVILVGFLQLDFHVDLFSK